MTTRPYAKVNIRLDALEDAVRRRVSDFMVARHLFVRTEEADRAHKAAHIDLDHVYVDVINEHGLVDRLSLPTRAVKHMSLP